MQVGIVLLCLAYVISQFFRNFLAVLSEQLYLDIGATSDDLAFAMGFWFLTFSLMQIPVGTALDKIGPKLTGSFIFLLGGAGGSIVFASATTPLHITISMGLIGVGCSPVLMGAYYIFARMYDPKIFASLAAIMIGVGSFGNLAGAAPLVFATDLFGWRSTMLALGFISFFISVGLFLFVENPTISKNIKKGSFIDLLKISNLWFIFPLVLIHYAPVAGIRGLWIGPYINDTFSGDGNLAFATTAMSLSMIAGTFAYGPMDRIFGTRKWIIFIGSSISLVSIVSLAILEQITFGVSVSLFCVLGFFGMSYPLMIAHGRSFSPEHLTGRCVTLLNMFAIGGAGLFQFLSGRIFRFSLETDGSTGTAYTTIFLFYASSLFMGLILYLKAKDRLD
ncbi:MFS transporter [Paracoccaceae bacterium]|nr:MFS transporter [Paracoccaceae bacterium]